MRADRVRETGCARPVPPVRVPVVRGRDRPGGGLQSPREVGPRPAGRAEGGRGRRGDHGHLTRRARRSAGPVRAPRADASGSTTPCGTSATTQQGSAPTSFGGSRRRPCCAPIRTSLS